MKVVTNDSRRCTICGPVRVEGRVTDDMGRGNDMATILVVDDDGMLCDLLQDLLTEEGYEVRCAHHGLAALDEIRQSLPDLVLTDIQMPHLDGLGLLRCLADKSVALPVVLMSAVRPNDVPVGVAFVAKPFDLDALLATVKGTLNTTKAAA